MVITGLTRNQLSGLSQTKGSNPLLSAKKNTIAKAIVFFSYIRLTASYMHLRCVIFASQVICATRVKGEYNITAERSEAISIRAKRVI